MTEMIKIRDLVIKIDPMDYKLRNGRLEMKIHIKGPKFEGDVIIGKWICIDCGTLNELEVVYCDKCGMDRPGESQ